jgi:hypothetical protein
MGKLRSLFLVLLCAGLPTFAWSPTVRAIVGLPRPGRRQSHAIIKRSRLVASGQSALAKSTLDKSPQKDGAAHHPDAAALAGLAGAAPIALDNLPAGLLAEASAQFPSLPRYLLFCSLLL